MPYKDKNKIREYQRDWVMSRRLTYIQKLGGKCISCGSTDKLEFHHRNRQEKFSHRIWSWKIELELSKCDLLCSKCHWDHTCKERSYKNNIHGTDALYRNGCKCIDCKAAHSTRIANWRKRTGRH